jgi:uncharacterized membrane protein
MTNLQFNLLGLAETLSQYYEQVASGNFTSIIQYLSLSPGAVALVAAISILLTVIRVGFMSYSLKTSRNEEANYKDMFNGFYFLGKVVLLDITINILVLFFSVLLIFPGIIAAYSLRQSYYLLLDDPDKNVLQCLRESRQLMQGMKMELFLLDLSFIGWNILDTLVSTSLLFVAPIPLPLVSIWLTPYIHVTYATYYNRLITNLTL